jgi:hypothetical protein
MLAMTVTITSALFPISSLTFIFSIVITNRLFRGLISLAVDNNNNDDDRYSFEFIGETITIKIKEDNKKREKQTTLRDGK